LAELIVWLCDRRRGVGADGALWMERLPEPGPVFRMHFFNNDGGRVQLCLNGGRCVARRAVELGWARERFRFRTEKGLIDAEVRDADVALWIDAPALRQPGMQLPAAAVGRRGDWLDTGDPHLVVELDRAQFEALDMARDGALLRRWEGLGAAGANVHFVWRRDAARWSIRSFERGVEGETLACGSGCISAFSALAGSAERVELNTAGGDRIVVARDGVRLRLSGPARTVFGGRLSWPRR
jgi:diaminopimelate epimerase